MPQLAVLILTHVHVTEALGVLRASLGCSHLWFCAAGSRKPSVICVVFDALTGNELGMAPETTAHSQGGWEVVLFCAFTRVSSRRTFGSPGATDREENM